MNKNSNFLYLMIAILAAAMGYFYIDKTNPEFFQNLMNKISNDESGWKDEVIPQEQEMPKDVKPTPPPKEEKDDLKITPPSDEELLPQDDDDDRPRRRR